MENKTKFIVKCQPTEMLAIYYFAGFFCAKMGQRSRDVSDFCRPFL